MSIVTRFAPSPTGYMHIGNARTALFNYLFARHHGGTFLLRIEDTDKERSTQEAIDKIFDSLAWMGLDYDGDAVFQSKNQHRHRDIAQKLLDAGKAYHCYCSPEDLEAMREKARQEGHSPKYDGTWRDRDPKDAPEGIKPVIRLKTPQSGHTTVTDLIQGDIVVKNEELDDMILVRSDGSPTYMLSVVVDDHDMGITHVIRGSDHLTNSFRQTQIFEALGWTPPTYSHAPLIHGSDGAKMSKRHGALGVEAYRDRGYVPEAICNYLLRLGWSHGDDEIISRAQAIDWFTLENVQKSPARFDPVKLTTLNAHYMREADNTRLLDLMTPHLAPLIGRNVKESDHAILLNAMDELKIRAKTTVELAESASFLLLPRPIPLDEKARKSLDETSCDLLRKFYPILATVKNWDQDELEHVSRDFAEKEGLKFGKLAQPLRSALTGRGISPGIFEVMLALGQEESVNRIKDVT